MEQSRVSCQKRGTFGADAEDTEKDGIQLKWIMLGGPDWFTTQQVCNPREWGCPDAITSDVSRPVDFRRPIQMLRLPNCGPWDSPRIDYLRLERQVQARMRGKPEKGASQRCGDHVQRIL